MYVRAVRFTDVSAERMQQLLARVKEAGGPPPGVPTTGLKVLFDEPQGTAVVLQEFETAEDMDAGAKVFAAGAFSLADSVWDDPIGQLMANLWAHLSTP